MSMYLMEQSEDGKRTVLTPPDLSIPLVDLITRDMGLAFRHGAKRIVLYVDDKPIMTVLPGERWEPEGVNTAWRVEHHFGRWDVVATKSVDGGRKIICSCSNPSDAATVELALNAGPANFPVTKWVQCPICDEQHMPFREEPDEEGRGYITCLNLACPSNVGHVEPVAPPADILTPDPEQHYGVGSYQGRAAVFVRTGKERRAGGTMHIPLYVPILTVTDAPDQPEKTVQMVADSLNLLATASTVIPRGPIYWSEEECDRIFAAAGKSTREVGDVVVGILRERNPL